MNLRSVVAVCGALATATVLTGCCGKKSGSSSSLGGSTGELAVMSDARVQFNAPAGWKRLSGSNGWTQFMAPDKYASLAFVTFDRPGESTARIGQMAGILNVQGIQWGSSQGATNLGRNGFPSRYGEGTCKLPGGDPCYLWYATVNPGNSNQVLIVYAVNTKVGSHHKPNAKAAVDSMRSL
ncbi:MAG: hypothetical protein IT374_12415 [Polyangiaceae bacterium]|nr:hypothetical protein [Polyangiaceae bacterium]